MRSISLHQQRHTSHFALILAWVHGGGRVVGWSTIHEETWEPTHHTINGECHTVDECDERGCPR